MPRSKNVRFFSVAPTDPLRKAARCINRNQQGAALVLGPKGTLCDILTDGDIRRALLDGMTLETPVSRLVDRRAGSLYPKPITAPVGTEESRLLEMMRQKEVFQIPLLDRRGRVKGLFTRRDLGPEMGFPLGAVVMAGGMGKRLRPLTKKTPKPMLRVGNEPLLERTLKNLRGAGIRDVSLATHYKGGMISDHFGDGHQFGLNINYIHENRPQGTAGSLRRLAGRPGPWLVINGDVLTDLDFRAMLHSHRQSRSALTVAVRSQEIRIPFGVVQVRGTRVTGLQEKPVLKHFINGGVYLLDKAAIDRIPARKRFDMTDLILRLLSERLKVTCFPVHEDWIDIGTPQDYAAAKKKF